MGKHIGNVEDTDMTPEAREALEAASKVKKVDNKIVRAMGIRDN